MCRLEDTGELHYGAAESAGRTAGLVMAPKLGLLFMFQPQLKKNNNGN